MYLDNEVSIDQQANVEKKIFAGNGLKIEDVPSWIINANFSRNETDLIAKNDHNETIVFVDFFTNFQLSSILSKNGLLIKGSILSTLAGPLIKGQYVQAANQEILSIGEVSSIDGNVKVTRLDGAELNLSAGDPVFQGDTIETSENGAVGLIFLDKTTLSLSDGGRMVLDELVYDPATGNGSMTVDMIEGAFSFVSGEIAKTGPDAMKVTTPVATVGIRGTTVAGKAAIEGNENSFTLLQDSDGNVGQISISNEGGTQVLAQIGATTSVSSFTAPPPPPIILSAAQIQANYGTALNVLPPTPAVAPTPQAAPPPQEEPEQGVEDTQDDEDTEEDISDEEVSDTEDSDSETSDEENELNEEGTLEGEEALDEEGLAIEEESANLETDAEQLPGEESAPPLGPDGEPLPLEEEGATQLGTDGEPVPSSEESVAPQLGPDGEPLSAEQETAGREAFEQALADGASPEEAMAAAAAAAGFEEPTPQGGPGDLGPAEVGDIGGGPINLTPVAPGTDSGSADFDQQSGPPVGLGFTGDPSADIFVNPGGGFGNPFISPSGAPGFGGIGNFEGPNGFGPDPYGGVGGTNLGSDPFGGPVDPIMGGGYHMGFTDPFGGPIFNAIYNEFGGGFIEAYGDGMTMDAYAESYYFDDPSLYDDYTDNVEEEYQSETLNETDYTLSGTSAADNLSASSSSNAYTLAGYAGNDILAGGLGDDVLWGGLGKDSLTGGDGADQFYYTNLLQGPDVITDFGQNGDADTLLFAHSPTSSYTRTSAVEMFSTVQAFDYSTNGNVLPYVFAFEDPNLYGVEDAIPLSNILTNLGFRIWGHQNSNTTLPDEDYFLLIPGASDVGINVFVWTDGEAPNGTSTGTGDGIVDYTELSFVASLAGGDTSNITGDEFAFQSISGFSV